MVLDAAVVDNIDLANLNNYQPCPHRAAFKLLAKCHRRAANIDISTIKSQLSCAGSLRNVAKDRLIFGGEIIRTQYHFNLDACDHETTH